MIIVDKREKNSLVIAELSQQKANFEIKHLEIGDYIVGNTVIERKTFSDFVSSMISKRLIKQLQNLKQYPRQILIIENEDSDNNYSKNVHPNSVRGMLLSILLDYQIPILFTKDYIDTASFLILLEKRLKKSEKEISLKPNKKAMTLPEQQQLVLESFPGIGPKTAKNLLTRFKTIKKIINATEEELEEARLNKKKIEIFKKIIETEFKED